MSHFCPHCAVELIEGSKFCSACGKNIDQPTQTDIQSQPQKQEEQPQTSTPPSTPQKSRKKLIIGLAVIIIAVVISLVGIVYLLGGTNPFTSADNRFVGEWEKNSIDGPLLWKFNSDNTMETESSSGVNDVGTWNVKDTQLCLYNNTVCYTYEFSNNGSILTLNIVEVNDDYPMNIVLTKKGQQENSITPNIRCTTDSNIDRITIASIDENIKWRDIAITTDCNATWQVQDTNDNSLARTGTTATISTYVTEGDSILILVTMGEVKVTLKYIPTNALLGTWTIYV